jgi:Peptidase M50B-like
MKQRATLGIAVILSLLATAHRAAAEPSDRRLVWVGIGLALPTYAIGVTLHEGSHALAARMMGAEVLSINLLPGRDPATGAFHFGLTRVRGLESRGAKAFFLLAPKVTDSVLLAGFAALVFSDAWPSHRYGELALTVLATGTWVDFSKDVLSFSPFNDVVKVMKLAGLHSEWQRLPVRLGYATVAVVAAAAVARGYRRTFEAPGPTPAPALMLPVLTWRY